MQQQKRAANTRAHPNQLCQALQEQRAPVGPDSSKQVGVEVADGVEQTRGGLSVHHLAAGVSFQGGKGKLKSVAVCMVSGQLRRVGARARMRGGQGTQAEPQTPTLGSSKQAVGGEGGRACAAAGKKADEASKRTSPPSLPWHASPAPAAATRERRAGRAALQSTRQHRRRPTLLLSASTEGGRRLLLLPMRNALLKSGAHHAPHHRKQTRNHSPLHRPPSPLLQPQRLRAPPPTHTHRHTHTSSCASCTHITASTSSSFSSSASIRISRTSGSGSRTTGPNGVVGRPDCTAARDSALGSCRGRQKQRADAQKAPGSRHSGQPSEH